MRLWTLHLVLALAGVLVTLGLVHFPRTKMPASIAADCAKATDSTSRRFCDQFR